jgi:hypothetical protein
MMVTTSASTRRKDEAGPFGPLPSQGAHNRARCSPHEKHITREPRNLGNCDPKLLRDFDKSRIEEDTVCCCAKYDSKCDDG